MAQQNYFGVANPVFQLAGANITTSFTFSSAFQVGRSERVRFYLQIILAGGSPITAINAKLQRRYNDFGSVQLPYTDIASTNDLASAAGTLEASHAYSGLVAPIAAPGTVRDFYLDRPYGVLDLTIGLSSTGGAGIAGDSVTVYAVLC